jgi:hypothetical protein
MSSYLYRFSGEKGWLSNHWSQYKRGLEWAISSVDAVQVVSVAHGRTEPFSGVRKLSIRLLQDEQGFQGIGASYLYRFSGEKGWLSNHWSQYKRGLEWAIGSVDESFDVLHNLLA